MRTQRVLCLVRGDDTDAIAIEAAVDLLSGGQRMLFLAYVILVDRHLPMDANLPEEVAHAELVLQSAEKASGLRRDELQGDILQGRSIGPAIVNEAMEQNVGAVVASVDAKGEFGVRELDADAKYLIANTPCTLLLIRRALTDFKDTDASPASSMSNLSARVG